MLPDARRDPEPGALDRACGVTAARAGRRLLSTSHRRSWPRRSSAPRCRASIVARIEVRGRRVASGSRPTGASKAKPMRRSSPTADILLRGAVPASVLDHVLSRAPRLDGSTRPRPAWIASRLPPVRERGPDRHERPRRLQPADRRVRGDDVPGHRPTASPAPGAPARADLAAAARARARRADGRDRRLREHRRGGRPPARGRSDAASWRRAAIPTAARERDVELFGLDQLGEVLRASDIVVVAAPLDRRHRGAHRRGTAGRRCARTPG